MGVRFLNLSVSEEEQKILLEKIQYVFSHGILVNGPEVSEFEEAIACYCGRKYAIGVNSGTDALYLGLRALGIGVADEVIIPCFSWIATANAVVLTGATPVFADINDDLNIDVSTIESLITPSTKAIMPVHYAGKIANMSIINQIAKKYNLLVIEDGSQAFGAMQNGRVSGSFGDMACFSLNPMKILAACGEAGVVLTDDEEVKNRLEILRYNGTINKETCVEVGLNGRLDTLQAAILLERLKNVENVLQVRRRNAKLYNELLKNIPEIQCPYDPILNDAYYTYTIQIDKRDELMEFLLDKGIEVKIYHPILMPKQPIYENKYKAMTDKGEQIIQRIVCLPIHEKLRSKEITDIANCINEFINLSYTVNL